MKNSSLREPLRKFRDRYPAKKNRIIAMFCDVNSDTVADWGVKRNPRGEPLNKLWHFLDAYGIDLPELRGLDPAIKYLGKLVAFNVLTPAQAQETFGLKGGLQPLWRILQGNHIPATVKKGIVTLPSLEAVYGQRLAEAIAANAQQGLVPLTVVPDTAPSPLEVETEPAPAGQNAANIVLAAALIAALEPLLRAIETDPMDVKTLRSSVSIETFHNVLDYLKAMASRKAYEFYHGKER